MRRRYVPELPTTHPFWPAFVAAVRANRLHPDLTINKWAFDINGRDLWRLFCDGVLAGAELKRVTTPEGGG